MSYNEHGLCCQDSYNGQLGKSLDSYELSHLCIRDKHQDYCENDMNYLRYYLSEHLLLKKILYPILPILFSLNLWSLILSMELLVGVKQFFSKGVIVPPRIHLAMSWRHVGCHTWGQGANSI